MSADTQIATNTKIVSRYQGWNSLPLEVIKGNIRTVNCESNRQPDNWKFEIRDRGLYDPGREGYVKDIVKQFPHPNLYLRTVEDNIIEAMDTWAVSDQEGFLIWFSASFDGFYDSHKIEILYKSSTTKETFNKVILFDGGSDICLKVAKNIFPELGLLKNVEELRNSVVIKDSLDIDLVLEMVGPYIFSEEDYSPPSESVINYLADLAVNGVDQYFIAQEMNRLGVIGKHSFSCDKDKPGLSNILASNSQEIGVKTLKCKCPECKNIVLAKIYGGKIHCPNCGAEAPYVC